MTRVLRSLALAGLALTLAICLPGFARAQDTTISVDVLHAEALYKDGKYKEAIEVLTKYLATHPSDATALVDRGDDYQALRDQKSAIADYTAALAINPDFAYAYASRCQSRYEVDQAAAALADCTKAIDLSPKLAYPHRERAMIELAAGDGKAALADASQAIALDADNPYGSDHPLPYLRGSRPVRPRR